MALQFDPTPYLEAYRQRQAQRPDWNQMVNQPLQMGLQSLVQMAEQKRQQDLQNKQLGWMQQEQDYKYGKTIPILHPTMGQLDSYEQSNSPILSNPSTSRNSLIDQFERNRQKFIKVPGSLDREEAFKREELRLKREENAANRDWNRKMSMDKFGLQQETFGLKKELEASKAEAERRAAEAMRNSKISEANDVISSIDKAIGKVGPTTTGFGGSVMGRFAGSSATDLSGDLSHINSLLGLAKLAEMKSQSKAGASGMGQLSEREMDLLISAVQSLKQSQSSGQLKNNLEAVKGHYQNWLKMENGINPYQNGGSNTDNDPLGIR